MLEKIIDLDKKVLIFLNGLGNEHWDGFWLFITKKTNWIPFFILLLYFIYKNLGTKKLLIMLIFIAFLITVSDQTSNLFKYGFERLRPCNDPTINNLIRIIKPGASFGFFSAHASNSIAVSLFIFLNFRKNYKYFWLIFIWPLLFGYSRIYLGLHFPLDILFGYLIGAFYGYLIYKIYKNSNGGYFQKNKNEIIKPDSQLNRRE